MANPNEWKVKHTEEGFDIIKPKEMKLLSNDTERIQSDNVGEHDLELDISVLSGKTEYRIVAPCQVIIGDDGYRKGLAYELKEGQAPQFFDIEEDKAVPMFNTDFTFDILDEFVEKYCVEG